MNAHFPPCQMLGAIALAALTLGCASTGATPKPFPMPAEREASRSAGPADAPPAVLPPREQVTTSDALIQTALALRGARYRNGGSTPDGFDCSGFTQYVFARHGVVLPREVQDQYRVGASIAAGEQEPGDLVFFTTTGPGASHVGIALDADTFVHAPSSNGVVRIERMSLPYWTKRFVGIRRPRQD